MSSAKSKSAKCCWLYHWIPCSVLSIAFFTIKSMTRRKRNGDKMHPYLAPVSTVKNSELLFSVFIQQVLFKYIFLMILMYFCGIPYKAAIFHSDSQCILSKAFLNFTKFKKIGCWNSVHCSIMFLSVKICSVQDRLLLMPACCSLSFKSIESFRRFSSIILSTFPGIDNLCNCYNLIKFPSKHSSWWRRLDQDKYVRLSLTSSEDVLVKTNIFVLAIRLQDVFKTFWSRPIYSS